MIISIASGKGGTGKTTVATNLAMTIEKGVQLLDCDVEEPNAHLFIRPEFDQKERVTVTVPEIDEETCTFCGECGALCQFKAIAVMPDTAILTFPELCHSCGGCWEVCPVDAIRKGERDIGTIERGHHGRLEFVHGRLRVGEAMAPPLIKKVRSYADPDKLTIIDAPPGTSCPVITSMRDTDFVLLVTEPTPFGLHDLKLAFEAVQTLNIASGLVVNRMGLGDDKVRDYADRVGLPILMEIPFDRRIAEAYSNGEMIVHALPQYKEKFLDLYRHINEIVQPG
jgi:MinD superfamily P-loop ATPase